MIRTVEAVIDETKLCPAVVLANAERGDWVLCQVTSKPYGDARAIPMETGDFAAGSLRVTSFARPGKLFTASQNLDGRSSGRPDDRVTQ